MHPTPRQIQILSLYSRGVAPGDIEAQLHIERYTIENHLKNVRLALGTRTTLQAVVVAVARGYMVVDRESEAALAAPATSILAVA